MFREECASTHTSRWDVPRRRTAEVRRLADDQRGVRGIGSTDYILEVRRLRRRLLAPPALRPHLRAIDAGRRIHEWRKVLVNAVLPIELTLIVCADGVTPLEFAVKARLGDSKPL